jgi:hypothetical protein
MMEERGLTLGKKIVCQRGLNLEDRTKEKDCNGCGRHVEGSGWVIGRTDGVENPVKMKECPVHVDKFLDQLAVN